MLQYPVIRYIALSLSLAFLSANALAQSTSGERPEVLATRPLVVTGQISSPVCDLTNAAIIVVNVSSCATNPTTQGVDLFDITLTQNSVFAFPTGLPNGGNKQFGFRINHGTSTQYTASFASGNSGYRFPAAQMCQPGDSTCTLGQPKLSTTAGPDFIWCVSKEGSPPITVDCNAGMLAMAFVTGDQWQAPGTAAGCDSHFALTNSNLTATQATQNFSFVCLAGTSHTTGFYYFFLTANTADTNSFWFGGIANASVNLGTYLGADNNSISLKNGQFFFNNGNASNTGPTIATGTVIRFDVDLTNKKLGVNVSGVEYPSGCVITTPSGCYDFSSWAGGAAFPAFSGSGNAADAATLNTASGIGPGGSFVLWQ